MSGSNSSTPGSGAAPQRAEALAAEPLSFAVHSLPTPVLATAQVRHGRIKMLLVLLVCAAPVIASYFTYYVVRPQGRTNHGVLVDPQRPLPPAGELPLTELDGRAVDATSLRGQWLLVAVAGGGCDAACERQLYLQRQLREALGKSKDRIDRVWLVDDAVAPRAELLPALREARVLRAPAAAIARWLQPADGQPVEAHLYLVDPLGNYMMRFPTPTEPERIKRDLERLLRASASWDQPGR